MTRTIAYAEVQEHRTPASCWVILYDHVYDVTSFLPHHPGGSSVILELSGTDATEQYDPIHPPGTLEESLSPEQRLGKIDRSTLPATEKAPAEDGTQTRGPARQQPEAQVPDQDVPETLEECLNLDDIEALATRRLSRKAWGYYFSAGDDLISKSFNNAVYRGVLLRPRVFVDCTRCSTATTMLGQTVGLPVFVSPAAMARLGHPDGEAGIARACAKYGVAQIISNNASQTPEQIVADARPGQVFGWQLYVQQDRQKSEAMLARIAKLPAIKFVVLTLDAPVPGKREHDERQKSVAATLPVPSAVQSGSSSTPSPQPDSASSRAETASGGVGKAIFAGTAADLTWDTTLPWLRQHTRLPIVLKGVQTHEDALLAARHAPHVRAVILSNHGGRALDTAPPALHTLLEIRKFCPDVLRRLEVYVDGGVRRGTDVVKALALGATAVGIGRAPLYGLGAGGQAGVERVLDILKAETETAMRLLGCEAVHQLGPRHVNARAVERDVFDGDPGLDHALVRSRL